MTKYYLSKYNPQDIKVIDGDKFFIPKSLKYITEECCGCGLKHRYKLTLKKNGLWLEINAIR
jgi:hypothetical protein